MLCGIVCVVNFPSSLSDMFVHTLSISKTDGYIAAGQRASRRLKTVGYIPRESWHEMYTNQFVNPGDYGLQRLRTNLGEMLG